MFQLNEVQSRDSILISSYRYSNYYMVTILISATVSCTTMGPKAFPTSTESPTDPSTVGAQSGLIAAIVSPFTVIVIGLLVVILFIVGVLVYKRQRKTLQGMYTHIR